MTDLPEPVLRPDGERARLLVVDDNESLVHLLSDALRFAGYTVQAARSGLEALRAVSEMRPDLVVLDVNLPDLDGFEVLKRLRQNGERVAVIFLSARDDPSDLRAGFSRGGDDYVTKPFSLEELGFRIQAVLRRMFSHAATDEVLRCGDLAMDVAHHRVWRGDEEVSLSPTEYRFLRYLLLNKGRVLSKMQILDHVWQYDFDGDASVVETYVSYLRRKVDSAEPKLIHTVRGFGYSLREPRTSAV